jgi:membrane-associated protein
MLPTWWAGDSARSLADGFSQVSGGGHRRDWAQRSLAGYGTRIIVACRFIPGGRTAVTLTCGLIGYPRRSFVLGTAVAGILWASYAFLLGRIGGQAFEGRPWAGLLVGLGLTVAVSGVIEAARRILRQRRQRQAGARPGRPGSAADPAPRTRRPASPPQTRCSTSPAHVLQANSTRVACAV